MKLIRDQQKWRHFVQLHHQLGWWTRTKKKKNISFYSCSAFSLVISYFISPHDGFLVSSVTVCVVQLPIVTFLSTVRSENNARYKLLRVFHVAGSTRVIYKWNNSTVCVVDRCYTETDLTTAVCGDKLFAPLSRIIVRPRGEMSWCLL